ncbi:Formate--tetrahydrofolate ligase [uncultured archaeon]|nr:Formate--tetrahydrofolate ligase [uncultured archaeon]
MGELLSDIEIAQSAKSRRIEKIAGKIGIPKEELEFYGRYKAKIPISYYEKIKDRPAGKLILVTAITPTSLGEGKTTTSIGLAQALAKMKKKAMVALREPSLGPVFGVKGGATGGGYSQVVPMEDINLHFTGDIHAITTANNLLAAMIDNHIFQGNELKFKTVTWKRCMDMNDRALRKVRVAMLPPGHERDDGFDISVASEVMAIFCLSNNLEELKQKLGSVIVGYNENNAPICARALKAEGAMAALLKDALNPNLVQTLEGVPAFVHGGPFANIAHGTNSIIATKMALRLSDYVVTESGFGSDLGAEKYFDIVSRYGGFLPDAVVIVASIRALKLHGGAGRENLKAEDVSAVEKGFSNLLRHVENMRKFGAEPVVAINRFPADSKAELKKLAELCAANNVAFALSEIWAKGGRGGIALAEKVLGALEMGKKTRPIYNLDMPLEKKIETVVREIYRGKEVVFSDNAKAMLERARALGFGQLPVCIAKTQYSFSDDAKLLNAPEGFTVAVREIRVSAGAGFVVAIAGDIMTMPGLPKSPAAERIDVRGNRITGLF